MADEGVEEWKSCGGLHMCRGCFNHDWCHGWFVRAGRIFTCFNQWSITAAAGMVRLQPFQLNLFIETLMRVVCIGVFATSNIMNLSARPINHIESKIVRHLILVV